jgi:protein SCO1/2
MKRLAYTLIALVALCTAAIGAIFVLSASRASAPPDAAELAFRPHPAAQLPLATQFKDENGRTVDLGDYFSKSPVILVLDYLRCTSLCSVMLRNIVESLDALPLAAGRDYQLVAISIDPRDTPADATEAKAKYLPLLTQVGAAAGLHFLTASATSAQQVADVMGFPYRYDKLIDAYIHPAGFIVATPAGAISRTIEGVAVAPKELIAAFADAQQDKSPGLLTRIVLFCHVQGAALGRFTVPVLAAFMLAEIAAALAALLIFAGVRRKPG